MKIKAFYKEHIGDRIRVDYFGHELTGVIYDAEVGSTLGLYLRTDEPVKINGQTRSEFRLSYAQARQAVLIS